MTRRRPSETPKRPSSRFEHLIVLSGYLVATLAMTYPVVRVLATALPMDHHIENWYPGDGDPWHFLWAFWYFRRALATFPPHLFWTDLVFFPIGFEMPFLTGIGAILVPAALLEPLVGLIVAHNLLWIASFVLAGYTMYVLGRYLSWHRGVAFFCGTLFMFSSYRMMHALEHLPIVMASWLVPLFAWRLFVAVEEPTTRQWVWCGLVLAVSAGISWYCTISLILYLTVFVVLSARRGWAQLRAGRHLRPVIVGALAMVVCASPFTVPTMLSEARDSIVPRPLEESNWYAADLVAFFVPSSRNPVFGKLVSSTYARFTGNPYEQTVYLGYVLLALAVLGALRAPRARARLFLVVAVVFFALALGPFLHVSGVDRFRVVGGLGVPLPYLGLHYVPILNGMRVPSRFTEVLVFSLTALAGFGLSAACARLATARARTALIGALLGCVAIEYAATPFPVEAAKAPAVYAEIGSAPGSFMVLELPLDWRIIKYHYYQTIHAKRMLVGHPVRSREKYSTYPPGLPLIPILRDPRVLLGQPRQDDSRHDAERLAAFFDIRYIVIHREYLDPPVFDALARFVEQQFPYTTRRVDRDVVVYELPRLDAQSSLWPDDYVVDFGAAQREFVLLIGWGDNERWGGATVQWSSDRESSMFVHLGAPADRVLEMRLLPFTCDRCPPQTIELRVNGMPHRLLSIEPGWRQYDIDVPARLLRPGLNAVTFRYGHAVAPAQVVPGNSDARTLAVAFDYVALRRAR